MIGELARAGFHAKVYCRMLGVCSPGFYKYRKRPMSPTRIRRQWLIGLIREVHTASRGTYGSRRFHAELTRDGRARQRASGRGADESGRHRRPSWAGEGQATAFEC